MTSHRTRRFALAAALGALVFSQSACMFKMHHELPVDAYFNHEPGGARRTRFADEAMKNWALAGLVPYSDFGAADLVEPRRGRQISDLKVRTRFSALDTVVWVIPGFAYGYYLWAPRHVGVEGEYVDGAPPVVRAIGATRRPRTASDTGR